MNLDYDVKRVASVVALALSFAFSLFDSAHAAMPTKDEAIFDLASAAVAERICGGSHKMSPAAERGAEIYARIMGIKMLDDDMPDMARVYMLLVDAVEKDSTKREAICLFMRQAIQRFEALGRR